MYTVSCCHGDEQLPNLCLCQVVMVDADTYRPRAGHAAVVSNDCLYVFGGTTLNSLLDELSIYCVTSLTWQTVSRSEPWPAARHGHAMGLIDKRIFVYGGVMSDGSTSNELWMYLISDNKWQMIDSQSSVSPPPVSGHTLTAVDNRCHLFSSFITVEFSLICNATIDQ